MLALFHDVFTHVMFQVQNRNTFFYARSQGRFSRRCFVVTTVSATKEGLNLTPFYDTKSLKSICEFDSMYVRYFTSQGRVWRVSKPFSNFCCALGLVTGLWYNPCTRFEWPHLLYNIPWIFDKCLHCQRSS